MTDEASVDDFILRADSDETPTATEEVDLRSGTKVVEAELAEDSFMTKIESDEADAEYMMRRIFGKFVVPDFPTVEEDGEELLDEDYIDQIVSVNAEELTKAFWRMNGADEEAIELLDEKRKEAFKEQLENDGDELLGNLSQGGVQMDEEDLYEA